MMKIAVLFRGPIRPNLQSVLARCGEFMQQFSGAQNVEFHTYLATWRYWRQQKASDLINLDLFDNVIMQEAPTESHRLRCTKLTKLPNGADIEPVYNMYYQSKTALDLIVRSDTYSYIIHNRTDLQMLFGEHINSWFDPNYYVAPHVHPNPWMCDQFGIAPGAMMHKAWDYGELDNLGRLIEAADKPETVLQTMIDSAGIPVRTAQYTSWMLDPARNN
jgi:hypothetical protein